MNRLFSFIATSLVALFASGQNVYVCGTFNDWDPKNPVELIREAEGLYSGVIDFSKGDSFKISTEKGYEGNGWSEFDAGTFALADGVTPALNEWLPLISKPKSGNMHAPDTKRLTLRVNLDEMLLMYDDGGSPATPWSGTLPLLNITTEGRQPITSKDTYLSATYYLDPMGVDGVEAIGSADSQAGMQIRGRGNYTWVGFKKKPYRVKLDAKTPILGMKKNKHFALLAHADDDLAFMRNTVGFAASQLLGLPWTPAQQPVEVVLNGDYIGLYFLTETIRVDKDRVNVVEQMDEATTDVDGGWLVEIDNYDSDPHVTVKENGGGPIWFTYKSPELLSSFQAAYLTTQMQSVDNAVYSSNKNDIAPLAALVDINILARYYIVQQIMCDEESFHGSCYLNRQRGEAERWKFGPVWDFGNAFRGDRGNNPCLIFEKPAFHQVWIGEIYKYPEFKAEVEAVWAEFLDADGPARLKEAVNGMRDRIAVAVQYSADRWPEYGNTDAYSGASRMNKYLDNSITFLKTLWGAGASVDQVEADVNAPVEYYDLYGRRVLNPAHGLYIRRQGADVKKVIVTD